jgi:alcohol dehydrogenase (cytochrome c)
MYFPNPLDVVEAIDAKTGDLKWQYRRKLPEDLSKFFPVPAINRNLAIYENLIIDTSADDYVFALNAQTGALRGRRRSSSTRRAPSRRPAPSSPTAR